MGKHKMAIRTEDRFALASKLYTLLTPNASEVALTLVGLLITTCAALMLTGVLGHELTQHLAAGREGTAAERAVFAAIALLLIYGNVVYQLARLGHYWRQHRHKPLSRDELEAAYAPDSPTASLMMLVPSYKEERWVIWQTLFSAALVEWPKRRVVLLLDDPPDPKSEHDNRSLAAARALPEELNELLRPPAAQMRRELHSFQKREDGSHLNEAAELQRLADLYDQAATWLERQADACPTSTHIDALFTERVLREPARLHRGRAEDLHQEARAPLTASVRSRISGEYRRLASLFDVEVTSFERKQFVNLSHEPNKAMNLNAYISLLGRAFRVRRQIGINLLEEAPEAGADLHVPNADYLITLDADSLLLSDYALRLVRVLEHPGNERVAVVQTPYTAVPGAETALERVAGATTDIQHIVHQGFTHWNGTYWVGANALLRRSALEEIKSVEHERGFPVTKYIESRTVIEDTESSVDLINKGWTLFNYPERLAYSATPPDFGALLIQRRRWANGGLLILPKLIRYLVQRPFQLKRVPEVFVRAHYLVSIAATNIGVLLLLVYPFEPSPQSIMWLALSAVPYYAFYGRDLVRAGYRWADLLRVNALNLALLPINLGGVWASVRQGITGEKTPFLRTPKVTGRTAVPAAYLLAGYALLSLGLVGTVIQATDERWLYAAFALGNAAFFGYAAVVFVGLRASAEDIAAQLVPPLRRVPAALRAAPSKPDTRVVEKRRTFKIAPASVGLRLFSSQRRRVGENN